MTEGPFKELFALDQDYSLLHFKDVEPLSDETSVVHNAARTCNIVSAYFFEKLRDPLTWSQISASPALQPFRSDWLARRWEHLMFSHVLSEHGAPTHFVELVELEGHVIDYFDASRQPTFLKVLNFPKLDVMSHCFGAEEVSYYESAFGSKQRRLIPLKVRFHHKLELGSQLAQRLMQNPSEGSPLGLHSVPRLGELFERPVLEFYTKAEEVERLLGLQEALLISGLTPGQFEEMVEFAYCISLALYAMLQQRGLDLDDGFLEFGSTTDGIMLVDSLSPLDMTLSDKDGPILQTLQRLEDPQQANQRWGSLCNQILGDRIFFDCPDRL
jgi:phosphoribosylaminoimidazole-succinocarboxamide synthase